MHCHGTQTEHVLSRRKGKLSRKGAFNFPFSEFRLNFRTSDWNDFCSGESYLGHRTEQDSLYQSDPVEKSEKIIIHIIMMITSGSRIIFLGILSRFLQYDQNPKRLNKLSFRALALMEPQTLRR